MYRCKICSNLSSEYTGVCSRCNGTEIEQIPDNAYTGQSSGSPKPSWSDYNRDRNMYPTPVSYGSPYNKPASGGKVQGIISMVLGIEAIATSVVTLFLILMLSEAVNSYSNYYSNPYYYGGMSPATDAITSIISVIITAIASAIASLCLASAARSRGNESKMPLIGRILSFITIGLNAFAIVLTMSVFG